MQNLAGVYAGAWTSLVRLSQAEKRILGIVRKEWNHEGAKDSKEMLVVWIFIFVFFVSWWLEPCMTINTVALRETLSGYGLAESGLDVM